MAHLQHISVIPVEHTICHQKNGKEGPLLFAVATAYGTGDPKNGEQGEIVADTQCVYIHADQLGSNQIQKQHGQKEGGHFPVLPHFLPAGNQKEEQRQPQDDLTHHQRHLTTFQVAVKLAEAYQGD